jgi:epoxide hydrolase-like predicted phosphatase
MPFRAVVFDIGGVLFRTADRSVHRKWEARLGLPEGGLALAIWRNPVADQAMIGQASPEEAWAYLGEQFSLSVQELAALQTDYFNAGEIDGELLSYIGSLKPKYKTGIISDAFLDARDFVQGYLTSELFDVIVVSAEEGVRKPDPEIFRRTLSRLGVTAEETIFVDDVPANVEGARALGIHAIRFTDRETVCAEIDRLIHS